MYRISNKTEKCQLRITKNACQYLYLYRKDNILKMYHQHTKNQPVQCVEMVVFQLIRVCYKKLNTIYTVRDETYTRPYDDE